MKLSLFSLFSFLWLNLNIAQQFDIKFSALNSQTAISSNLTPFVFKDSKGLLWISTIDGVNVYDGQNLKIFKGATANTHHDIWGNMVQSSFFEDKNSNIWFTTYNAINCYKRAENKFEHYFLYNEKGVKYETNYWGVFIDSNDKFWVSIEENSDGKLIVYDTKQHTQTHLLRSINKVEIEENTKNITVLGTDNEKRVILHEFKDYQLTNKLELFQQIDFKNEYIYDLKLLNNKIWAATTKGFFSQSLNQNRAELLLNQGILDILILDKTNMLLTSQQGITQYNILQNKTIQFWDNALLNIVNPISVLYLDKDNGLWATNKYKPSDIYYANLQPVLFKTIRQSIFNKILITDKLANKNAAEIIGINEKNDKLLLFNSQTQQVKYEISLPYNNSNQRYNSLFVDKNEVIWYSSRFDIYYYKETNKKWNKIPNPQNLFFWNIKAINQNRLIACTNKGLVEIKDNKFYPIEILQDAKTDITNIFEDSKGNIHINQDANEDIIARFTSAYTLEISKKILLNGFWGNHWEDRDKNEIWLSTNIGLCRLNLNNYQTSFYGEKEGLKNQYLTAVFPDKTGSLWACSGKGITRFDMKKLQFMVYDKSNGLISEDFSAQNAIQTPDGNLWCSGKDALITFNPNEIKQSSYKAPLHIYALKINDIDQKEIKTSHLSTISLNYDENNISLQFVAIDYMNPNETRVAYRLEGWDEKWDTCLTANGFARYSNLSNGHYKMLFTTSNADGVWSDEIHTLYIEIRPPFYLTWWFWLLCAIFLIGLGYYFYQRQIKKVREQEREKGEIQTKIINSELKALKAQMNPHFVNNCLNSISNFILKNDNDNAFFYLTKFARLMRLVLNHSNVDFVKLKDEITALTYYLEMESLRFSASFTHRIEIAEDIDSENTRISPMLIQPFVENAIWHGLLPKKGGEVTIRFEKDNNVINCIIEDNGIGRKKSAENKGTEAKLRQSFGMTLIQDRLDILYKMANIPREPIQIIDKTDSDNIGTGTKIIVKIPTQIS